MSRNGNSLMLPPYQSSEAYPGSGKGRATGSPSRAALLCSLLLVGAWSWACGPNPGNGTDSDGGRDATRAEAGPGDGGRQDGGPQDGADTDATGHCGNGTLETNRGEECDDGNSIVGDGCDDQCRNETLSPDFVQVRNGRIFVRDRSVFLVGAAWLPQGARDADALAAGFNLLIGSGTGGYRVLGLTQSGQALQTSVASHKEEANVIAWLGPDEPAWNGMSAATLQGDYAAPLASADDYHRPFMINHAPRGTQAEPNNFDLLLPYLDRTQIVSMDIYPIPEGNGHSNLTDHQGLDAVGAYTDILKGLVAQSGRDEAVVMVIQGAGMGHIPGEGWNNLEQWQTDPVLPPDGIRFVQAGDFDGDGTDELAVGTSSNQVRLYDFPDFPWGGSKSPLAVPGDLDLDSPIEATSGDFNGDGTDDLALFVDQGPDSQDIWILDGRPDGFAAPRLAVRMAQSTFDLRVVRQTLAGDFDGDGCDDLLLDYDYPDPDHQTWFLLSSACSGYDPGPPSQAQIWYDAPTSVLDLERISHAAAADLDQDGLTDLLVSRTNDTNRFQVLWLRATASGFQDPQVLLEDASGTLDPNAIRFMAARDLDGASDGRSDLLLGQADPSGQGPSTLLVGHPVPGTVLAPDDLQTWLSKPQGELDLASASNLTGASGLACADLDGDGLSDLVLLTPDAARTATRFTAAFSTSTDFGARDPLEREMLFMALDAAVHGAAGVVFWAQQFLDASSVVWTRLQRTGSKLAAIRHILALPSSDCSATEQTTCRLYQDPDSTTEAFVLACHESRNAAGGPATMGLPATFQGNGVLALWDFEEGRFAPWPMATVQSGSLTDQAAFGPYECRIYRLQ